MNTFLTFLVGKTEAEVSRAFQLQPFLAVVQEAKSLHLSRDIVEFVILAKKRHMKKGSESSSSAATLEVPLLKFCCEKAMESKNKAVSEGLLRSGIVLGDKIKEEGGLSESEKKDHFKELELKDSSFEAKKNKNLAKQLGGMIARMMEAENRKNNEEVLERKPKRTRDEVVVEEAPARKKKKKEKKTDA